MKEYLINKRPKVSLLLILILFVFTFLTLIFYKINDIILLYPSKWANIYHIG
jgi:hypothetical protein